MEKGYFFVKYSNFEYRLIRLNNGIVESVLISDIIKNKIDSWTHFPTWLSEKQLEFFDIPLPFNCEKYDYSIGDLAFVINNSFLKLVKILKFGKYISHVQSVDIDFTKNVPNKNLIPYNYWILHEKCKFAMFELSKCLKRKGIYKDIRVYIAKWLWVTKNDYIWECNHKHSRRRSCHKKIKNYKC